MRNAFPNIKFQGELRPSQREVAQIAAQQLQQGNRRLHIVAPPGAGKTVLGLYLWSEFVRTPALVLSPNSAIQSQWAARTDLFAADGISLTEQQISTQSNHPGLLTSLTYQSVTLPSRGSFDIDLQATALWVDRLLEQGHADTPESANEWINDLRFRNSDYFNARLSSWRKQARDEISLEGRTLDMLHDSSKESWGRLKDIGVGLVILDECHHLMGHWGRVLSAANELLDHPVVIGLTATPPDRDGHKQEDISRYDDYFGPIDYEVPVPAVVKDGFLAPYQDLVYFVRPTEHELRFVEDVDQKFRTLLDELCNDRHEADESEPRIEPLPAWLSRVLRGFELPGRTCETWKEFERRDSDFALSARQFLAALGIDLPEGVPPIGGILNRVGWRKPSPVSELPTDVLKTVLDRYIRHGLRRSQHAEDQRLCVTAIDQLRMLGIQITETGVQKCASPITRILGYTQHKAHALVPILSQEIEQLDEHIRAVVICDYEKSSATSANTSDVLNEEAGGAVSAFRTLVKDDTTNTLDPVLMTGSTVLVDHDMADLFLAAANHWLAANAYDVDLTLEDKTLFHVVSGAGKDWCPRVYIQMVTQLFQDGITRCLVGTRGLLGEGWDANRINVLIDLTTVTTSMTVNQLRGRSIRLDPLQPDKVANNWDVTCVAPEFARGMDDFERLCRKHQTIYGVTDDGAIEKGIGHVHASLADMSSDVLVESMDSINEDMLNRSTQRQQARTLWQIGSPYVGTPIRSVEAPMDARAFESSCFATAASFSDPWQPQTLTRAMARCVVECLIELEQLTLRPTIRVSQRQGGYVRIYLENTDEEGSMAFSKAMQELLQPIDSFERLRYMVPLVLDKAQRKAMTGWMPNVVGRYFEDKTEAVAFYLAIPSPFSKNKSLVESFEVHWNDLVSTGDAISCRSDSGKQTLATAQQNGLILTRQPQIRDCFL